MINESKYVEVLEFLLDREHGANNLLLGKVKLMKLLYFADFDHYFAHGASITGETYVKLDFGPVPRHADEILRKMGHELEELRVERVGSAAGFQYRYNLQDRSIRQAQYLTSQERDTLVAVVNRWRDSETSEIVSASHADPPWRMVRRGEEIPYHLVYYRRHVAPVNDEEPPIIVMQPS